VREVGGKLNGSERKMGGKLEWKWGVGGVSGMGVGRK